MLGNAASSIIIAGIVLGIIIVIHELGHFLVAKFFKIKVETFSVGFGPRLIGFRKGDTDYRISAFPLGSRTGGYPSWRRDRVFRWEDQPELGRGSKYRSYKSWPSATDHG